MGHLRVLEYVMREVENGWVVRYVTCEWGISNVYVCD
jgi:hypothetical protein